MRQKSSKTILVTMATALVVIGLVFVGGSQIRDWVRQNLFKQYVAREATIARQVVGDLENEIADTQDKLKVAAMIPAVRNPTNAAACNDTLVAVLNSMESKVGNLGRVSAQDIFVCSVNKALVGTSGSKLGTYLPEIIADPKHKPVMSHVISPPGAGFAVALHVPVQDGTGQFAGTLGGAIYLKDLQDKLLKNISFGKNGFAIVFDDNGDILYHPQAELIGKNLSSPELQKMLTNAPAVQKAVADAVAGHTGTVQYGLNGVEKVAAYQSAQVLPNHRWVVMATVPVADAADLLKQVGVDQAFWMAIAMQTLAIILVAFVVVLGTLRAIRLPESLRQEKAKIQTMLSSIGDGVMAIDRKGSVILLNGAAVELTGWSDKEAVGRPWREVMNLIDEHDRKPAGAFIELAMKVGKKQHMAQNTLLVRRDGREVPVGDSAAPMFGRAGTVTGAIVVFRDFTDEREAARMKSDFAYASHQFRTPLTQAMSAVSLAQGETNAKLRNEDLAMAETGISSAHRLALKMLAMADVDNGRVEMKVADVDVPELVKTIKSEVGEHLAKDLEIRTNVAAGLKTIRTDHDLFKKIVTELLYNGADYGDGKLVELGVQTRAGTLMIQVRNGGLPISEEDQVQIFTRFFRGANRPAEVAGAGLGLYLVQQYVRLLGGKIWLTSGARGTTFWVELPINADPLS